MTAQEIAAVLREKFADAVLEAKTENVLQSWVQVAPGGIKETALFLRDDERMRFDLMMCLSGMDYGGGTLGVVYHLNSTVLGHKITLKVRVAASDPRVESVEEVWKTADWHEREAFDLFGIVFDHHPDLRRILMPDDWEGYPLRKDYAVPEYYNGMKVPY
jgi:NADH-quinone oxidoreductase subunit C